MNPHIHRALPPPLHEGVEQQLRAPKRVLLPPIQLVVDGEGDAFFECAVGVRGPADEVAALHEAECHVEVFGDVGFGPDFFEAVGGVDEGGVLEGAPSEEGVVADEGSYFAVCAGCKASSKETYHRSVSLK